MNGLCGSPSFVFILPIDINYWIRARKFTSFHFIHIIVLYTMVQLSLKFGKCRMNFNFYPTKSLVKFTFPFASIGRAAILVAHWWSNGNHFQAW